MTRTDDDGNPHQWSSPRPQTMVDHAVEAIVSGAARGLILPGDRIVEVEIAKLLGMSRVPVREALRILESQGVVTSAPFKGIRLMEVSPERLLQVSQVRIALEVLAARTLLADRDGRPRQLKALGRALDELDLMAARGDVYGLATADTAFHRCLCRLSGNDVLSVLWESLARQLTIIFGLSTIRKPMAAIVGEHRHLLDVISKGNPEALEGALREHILVQVSEVDFDRIISERRSAPTK